MVLVGVIVGLLVVMLAIAAVFDQRSRKVRGRAGRVRVPGGEMGRKAGGLTALEISKFDAGQKMIPLTRNKDQDRPRAD